MGRKSKHKERTREKIIQSATQMIRKKGMKQLGVADVMNNAGLTHGGFYAHFSNKDELISDAVQQICAETVSQLHKSFEGKSAKQGLKDYISFYLSENHRDGKIDGCFIPILTGNIAYLSDTSKRRFGEGFNLLAAFLSGVLKEVDETYSETVVTSLLSEMVGAVKMSQAVQNPDQSDKILHDTRLDILDRFALN